MRAGLLALPTKGRVALAFAGLALGAAILLGGASPGTAAPSSGIVVNEVYGGGGNSGATYTNDFIELRNRGTAAVEPRRLVGAVPLRRRDRRLAGHAAQRLDRARRALPGRRGAGAGGTQPLPTAHATGTIAMSGTSGTVALVNGTTALTCARLRGLPGRVVDLVGYGTAAITETAPAPARPTPTRCSAPTRADTDDNAGDFTAAPPTPGATNVGGDGGGTRRRRARPAAHPRHPGHRAGSRRTTASRSPTCPASSPRSAPTGSSAATGSRTRPPTRPGHQRGHLRLHLVARRSPSATRCSSPARSATSTRCPAATPSRRRRTCRSPRSGPRPSRAAPGNALPAPVVIGADHGARRLRPGSRRRQHRVDADHAEPLGAGLLGVARGHARRGRRRPRGRPVQQLRRAVRHHQADAGGDLPRRHRAAGRERDPVRPPRGRAGQRRRTPASTSATCSPAPPSARSTTRSSAAT